MRVCLSDADRCLQSDVVSNGHLQVLEGAAMAASCPEFISTKFKNEELTLHRPNHELLWEASEAAVGAW